MNDRVKEVVSREAIIREIKAARKKLVKMRETPPKSPTKREAIFRQLLQLELCDIILHDVHML